MEDIFRIALQDATKGTGTTTDNPLLPMQLSHVCSKWRDVATNSPYLWTNVTVQFPTESTSHLIKLWLTRGRSLPVHVTIRQFAIVVTQQSVFEKLVELLAEHSHRWKSVSVELGSKLRPFVANAFASIKNLDRLAVVKIRFHVYQLWEPEGEDKSMDEIVRRLCAGRSLQVFDYHTDGELVGIPSLGSWAGLKKMSLRNCFINTDFFGGLRACRVLEELSLQYCNAQRTQEVEEESKIEIPTLTTLQVGNSINVVQILMTLLVTPELRTLEIAYCGHEATEEIMGATVNNLVRSQAQLHTFIYHDTLRDNEETFLTALSSTAFACIRKLDLHGSFTDEFAKFLMVPNQSGMEVLPNLTSLSLAVCAVRMAGLLKRMVASRFFRGTSSGTVAQLNELQLGISRPHIHVRDTEGLEKLRNHGLKFGYKVSFS